MNHPLWRYIGTALVACVLALSGTAPSYAVNASAFISGIVTNNGAPSAHVVVTAAGNNLTVKTTTDARGRFSFPPLALGTYDVEARDGDLRGLVRVDLGSGGASITIALEKLAEIEHTVVSQSQSLTIHGSGSDVVLNSTALTRLPFDNSFTQMQTQMPGAAQGANGVVHINGDHGVINYQIDGVQLPQELNRDIGSEINLNDLSFVDLIEGAYPAQYGLKFGAVFNMSTLAGTGPPGFYGYGSFGSYTNAQSTIGYHAPIEGEGVTTSHSAGSRQRPASIRLISTRLTTMQARSVSSLASRSLPVATTSRTSRSSTLATPFRFPTTLPTANRATPTPTRHKAILSWRSSFTMRSGTRA